MGRYFAIDEVKIWEETFIIVAALHAVDIRARAQITVQAVNHRALNLGEEGEGECKRIN